MVTVIRCLIAFFVLGITSQALAHKTSPEKTLRAQITITATVTAYTPSPKENCGRGRKVATALGTPVRPGIVAVSRDLLRSGWEFGDRIHIEGLGVFTIEDTMHQRFRRTIDVAVADMDAARRIGFKRGIAVTLLEDAPLPQG